jgi:dihydrofolate reductase
LLSGDVPLDESGALKVSQTSYDYTRPYWDQIGATVVGRHVFDMTDGWGGKPPGGIDHVVVVTHRPEPEGWDPEAPFHFVDGVEAAVAKAQELAGDRIVEVAAGDVGGQVLAAGLIDEVRMDVVPVVFGSGKLLRFGRRAAPVGGPDVVTQGNRVLTALSGAPLTDLSGCARSPNPVSLGRVRRPLQETLAQPGPAAASPRRVRQSSMSGRRSASRCVR